MAGNALVHFEEREHQGIARERVRIKEPERIDSKYCAEYPSVKGNFGSACEPLNRDQSFDIRRKSCQMATETLNANVHYSESRTEENLPHPRPPGLSMHSNNLEKGPSKRACADRVCRFRSVYRLFELPGEDYE